MKKIFMKAAAALTSAALSLCTFSAFSTALADDGGEETITYSVSFDWEEEGVTPFKTTDVSLFEAFTTEDSYVVIPEGKFVKTGYTFSGWTVDGIHGYSSGSVANFDDYGTDIVFHACWTNNTEKAHTVSYVLEYEGEIIENKWLKDEKRSTNEVFLPNYSEIKIDDIYSGIFSRGLTDGERVYPYGTQLVMPDHDVVLYPIFFRVINVTYYAGDVDRLLGNTTFAVLRNESSKFELADSDRFSRTGFRIGGWESSYDGIVYPPGETVVCPNEDISYTAVWIPRTYSISFKQGNGGENIIVKGETDSAIICPEPTITVAGKHFDGWKDSEGVVHAAGDEYIVPGAMPGLSISLSAVWAAGEAPQTTTAANTDDVIYGDANLDGKVSAADAVAILQSIGNSDKYGLSAQGKINADVDGVLGITPKDALVIQQVEAGIYQKSDLPLKA